MTHAIFHALCITTVIVGSAAIDARFLDGKRGCDAGDDAINACSVEGLGYPNHGSDN